tara:strand:+ start:579 stop:848 length:270 start_codon:yes stop_codon:yes gene_type:complete
MEISLLELYHPLVRLSIILKRTTDKKYRYLKQYTAGRAIYDEQIIENLDDIKGDLMGELINGYIIKHNILGIDFVDGLMDASKWDNVPV